MNGLNPATSQSARQAWGGTIEQMMTREGDIITKAMHSQLFGKDFASAEILQHMKDMWSEMQKVDVGSLPSDPGIASMLKSLNANNLFEVAGQVTGNLYLKMNRAIGNAVKGKVGGRRRQITEHFLDSSAKAYAFEDEVFKLWRFKQILNLQDEFRKTQTISKDMRRVLGDDDAYMMSILDHVDGADAWRAAAADAHKYYFDYTDVNGVVDAMRKTTIPFFTYMTKAPPVVAEWMAKYPVQGYFWRQGYDYMNFMNEYLHGEGSMDEIVDAHQGGAMIGPWAQLTAMPLATGQAREFDVERTDYDEGAWRTIEKNVPLAGMWDPQYYTQLANYIQMSDPRGAGFVDRMKEFFLGQTPLTTTFRALGNHPDWDKWGVRGGKIWQDSDSFWLKFNKFSAQMWRTWAPAYLPGIPLEWRGSSGERIDLMKYGAGLGAGGRSGQKIAASVGKVPDARVSNGARKMAEYMDLIPELMFGYKVNWVEQNIGWIDEQATKDSYAIDEVARERKRSLEGNAPDYDTKYDQIDQDALDDAEFLYQFDLAKQRYWSIRGYRFGKAIQAGNGPWPWEDDD